MARWVYRRHLWPADTKSVSQFSKINISFKYLKIWCEQIRSWSLVDSNRECFQLFFLAAVFLVLLTLAQLSISLTFSFSGSTSMANFRFLMVYSCPQNTFYGQTEHDLTSLARTKTQRSGSSFLVILGFAPFFAMFVQ